MFTFNDYKHEILRLSKAVVFLVGGGSTVGNSGTNGPVLRYSPPPLLSIIGSSASRPEFGGNSGGGGNKFRGGAAV